MERPKKYYISIGWGNPKAELALPIIAHYMSIDDQEEYTTTFWT
jgi:hypothetical protein